MAKKTKDSESEKIVKKSTVSKTSASVKKPTAKKAVTKKSVTSKTSAKKTSTKKSTVSASSAITKRKTDTVKKTAKSKASTKKVSTKTTLKTKATDLNSSSKKVAQKKTVARKSTSIKKVSDKKSATIQKFQAEYYDLPYFYNKTVVKILAQTPKMLFIYWEISDFDRESFKQQYGENFFDITRPVLIVYNDTMHYSFEVDINDFANSWYLHINDANCEYHIELGRRPIPFNNFQTYPNPSQSYIPYYVYFTSSNEMAAPNNRILFNPSIKTIRFRNVKTGQIIDKDIKQFTFITNFGIFTLQDLYKFLFPDEDFEFDRISIGSLSSRGQNSSGIFTSQFK